MVREISPKRLDHDPVSQSQIRHIYTQTDQTAAAKTGP